MQLMRIGVAALLTLASLALATKENSDVTSLNIETTFTPDSCSIKSAAGDRLKVHYTGTLYTTGAKFDSSRDRNSPFELTLGAGQVIKGWDEGLVGMCVGERRILTIPSTLAYGTRNFGSKIPANSALVFDVELVDMPSRRDEL